MRSGRGSSSSVHLADVGRRRGQKWALTLGTECGVRGSCSGAAAGLRASGTRGGEQQRTPPCLAWSPSSTSSTAEWVGSWLMARVR